MLSFLNSEEKRVLSQGNLKNYHAFVTWPQTPKYITGIRECLKKLTDTEEQLNKFSENKIERVLAEIQKFLSKHPQSLRVMGTCTCATLIVLMMYGGFFLDINLLVIMTAVLSSLFILTMTTIKAEQDDWNFIPKSDRHERLQNLNSVVREAKKNLMSFFNENKLESLAKETTPAEMSNEEREALLAIISLTTQPY